MEVEGCVPVLRGVGSRDGWGRRQKDVTCVSERHLAWSQANSLRVNSGGSSCGGEPSLSAFLSSISFPVQTTCFLVYPFPLASPSHESLVLPHSPFRNFHYVRHYHFTISTPFRTSFYSKSIVKLTLKFILCSVCCFILEAIPNTQG